jgi:hypothetical protein
MGSAGRVGIAVTVELVAGAVELVVCALELVVGGTDLVDVVELAGAVVAVAGTVVFVEPESGGNTRYPSLTAVGSSIGKSTWGKCARVHANPSATSKLARTGR